MLVDSLPPCWLCRGYINRKDAVEYGSVLRVVSSLFLEVRFNLFRVSIGASGSGSGVIWELGVDLDDEVV